ncbi:MAG: PAS domain S-box protein, partial [Terriglobia bacterium]
LPLKTADGRPTDVEFVSNSYQVDGKKVIQCNVRDITQRKRAEKQLRRLNRALRTISECNQVLVRATDELDLNNQICRILVEHGGYRMAWVGYAEQDEARSVRPVAQAGHDEGYLAEARVTWADTERGRGPTGKAVRSGTVCVVRQTSTEPNYEPWRAAAMRHGFASAIGLPLVANGHTLGALTLYAGEVGAFDDAEVKLLTELANDLAYGIQALRVRAAHLQAEISLIRLRKAVEASGEVIFMTDRDSIITFINPEFTRVYGYTEAEVVGKTTPRILKSGTLQPADYASFWKTILEKRVARGEIVNKTKNGRLVSVHSSVNPVLDEGGHIAGFLAIQRDVSERKQMEQQFRQAQKMEALGQLAGGVAHDFNNLLTVISGYSELLADGLGQDGPRIEQLKQIQNAAGRAASLTRQLLAFGRRQTMVMEVMDINSAVARAEKMLRRVIGENIELVTRPAPGLGRVKADPGQVEQVVINLAINARDAMPQGGKLIIATANVEVSPDDSRCRSGLKPGAYVLLTVADTGSGIDPRIKANIFEPFFTTKERGKGTGLGLATVYGIVQQSGGFVSVETELGSGSTFKVLLPRIEQPLTPPAMEPAAKNHRPCTETVLVVEDEPPLRTMVRGILESCGYRVLEAGHGGEALAICERHEGPIHLVLTDVVMPQMGGPELALRLASRWPQVRILYMSGYTDDAIADAVERGANHDFIAKPFTPKTLTSKVREALDAKLPQ